MSQLDKLFGGKPGDANKVRQSMRRTYGPAKGEKVFEATVIKRQQKTKRRRKGLFG